MCDEVSKENYAKVVENLKTLSNPSGLMQVQGMLSIKRKVFPKNKESLPFAKKVCDGKIITSQNQIENLYLETLVHRLRNWPIKENV